MQHAGDELGMPLRCGGLWTGSPLRSGVVHTIFAIHEWPWRLFVAHCASCKPEALRRAQQERQRRRTLVLRVNPKERRPTGQGMRRLLGLSKLYAIPTDRQIYMEGIGKMELIPQLQEDMKAAMKAGAKDKLAVVRMLLSEAKNADLQSPKKTPLQMVEAYCKKLKGTIAEFEKLNKPDEVTKLKAELAIVEAYLPKKLDEAGTTKLVEEFLAANSFTEKEAGKATGLFTKQHGASVDGGIASKIIREKLAGK
ncbi:MAG: GatB/YqeY domain-containing protein [Tepidisphaeraceae bacterium]